MLKNKEGRVIKIIRDTDKHVPARPLHKDSD